LFVLCVAGCAGAEHPATIGVTLGEGERAKAFTLEVAVTEAEIQRGLMDRDTLAEDGGMIFVFAAMGPQSFWMKDCRIPLDMIFFDNAGRIVAIFTLDPPRSEEENRRPPRTPYVDARFIIELNAGEADKLGLKRGDKPALPLEAIKALAE
jgi:uncharacterized membrane protein (UPF0127 family)